MRLPEASSDDPVVGMTLSYDAVHRIQCSPPELRWYLSIRRTVSSTHRPQACGSGRAFRQPASLKNLAQTQPQPRLPTNVRACDAAGSYEAVAELRQSGLQPTARAE